MNNLLPSEQYALDFVLRIGRERATRLLELVTGRISRRIRVGNEKSFGQFLDESCIRKAPWEVELTYQLKMGLQLSNTDTPAAAHERILKRIAERKERAALRRQSKTSAISQ
ncbi:hypothetical protein L1267_22205 [Pseudoalteromonas sp. OFAV1]|uniref:hypothetical protein n=1 Tax=Pseudoalteromonas sp. OFAV1 TaxID=2908892 RepID=UPI001F25ECE1|nr:hypothetical protein [Pseudoalteromonas sp. OFAV1]MCF2903086.1 hypothetical protein [Pseudoalteromonas sp. OFAV1]